MSGFAYTVPIQGVHALAELARQRGWDADELLRSVGMSPLLLGETRSRVTPDQISALTAQVLRATHDELLGLGVGPVPRGTFQMLGYALLGAADLGQALVRLQRFRRVVPGIPPIRVTTEARATTLSIDISVIPAPLDILVDTMLAATHRTMGWATNSLIRLSRVDIPHPGAANVDDYDAIFGAPIAFCAPRPALVFPATALASPIMRSEVEWETLLRNAPAEILARRDYAVSLANRVRRILELGLGGRWPTADDIAERLAMSPQTVRRKLRSECTSLSQIRDDILRDAAITSLVGGQETIAALSARLGFSEPSAFNRAFRRWTGTAPGTYRLTSRQ